MNQRPAWLDPQGASLWERARAMVRAPWGTIHDDAVDRLARDLFAWQRARNAPYARYAAALLGEREPAHVDDIPALPTDVFKHARVACFDERYDARVFATSGTTRDVRGLHPFADVSLYAEACLVGAARWLLPSARYRCVFLAEDERAAPTSSLTFMLVRFAERWGDGGDAFYVRDARVDVEAVTRALDAAVRDGEPVALLGTTWAFVHLDEALGDRRWALPTGSVAMPTGGTKGRARELSDDALRAAVRERYGLPREGVIAEYGMTELSSQAWEATREGAPGRFRAPPWMRVTVVDPSTLRPVPAGEVGFVRVVDLLNVGSAVAVQTSDLGRVDDGGLALLGRAPDATPRGCARAMDALLSGDDPVSP
ncbi:MAG: acyl-protein synthetase [Polyangiales bacterium]